MPTYTADTSLIANQERGFFQYTETKANSDGSLTSPLNATTLAAGRTGTTTIKGYTFPAMTVVFRYYYLTDLTDTNTLPSALFTNIAADMKAIRDAGCKAVIRFAYPKDTSYDATPARTLSHIDQLAPTLNANADVIHALQAGFIGRYGEWYYSDNYGNNGQVTATDTANRNAVVARLLSKLDSRIFILLRYVGSRQTYLGTTVPNPGGDAVRLGMHNDAFLAPYADYGTYKDFSSQSEDFNRTYVEQLKNVPIGGESANYASPDSDWANASSMLASKHWGFLNPNYYPDTLSSWGQTNLDTVTRTLGHRLRLVSSTVPSSAQPGNTITVRVVFANDGWAAPTRNRPVNLILDDGNGNTSTWPLNVDIRALAPGQQVAVDTQVAVPNTSGVYQTYLQIPDPSSTLASRPEYALRLANTNMWDAATGRNSLAAPMSVSSTGSSSSAYAAGGTVAGSGTVTAIGSSSGSGSTGGSKVPGYTPNALASGAVISKAALDRMEAGIVIGIYGAATINVVDPVYGGKGDGIILNDLTVSSGSKSISSNTAPFTSTAVDKGKLVIWLTGATTEVGVIDTVQSTTQATLVSNANASSVAFGGPNTNAAIGTDNTAAINAALTAVQAVSTSANANRRSFIPSPTLYFPAGVFLTKGGHVITQPGGSIRGEAMNATYIVGAMQSGTIFQHGTFNSSPQDAFQGTAFSWSYTNMRIMDATRLSTGTENQRTVLGIVDYGCGNIRMNNVRFSGLKYGFAGAHGSDFSDIRDCYFQNCDVCYYFGPGCQQVNISKTDCTDSRENAVFEGAPHWHIGDGSSFEDASVSSVTIEGKKSGTTRFGLSPSIGGAFYSGNFIIDGGVWFETNAGGNGRIAPRIILFTGDGPFGVPAEGLTLRDGYVISGGSQQSGGTNTVIEYASDLVSDQPVIVDGLYMSDPSYVNSVYRFTGTAANSKPRLENVRKPSSVALTQGNASGAKIINRDGTMRGFTTY